MIQNIFETNTSEASSYTSTFAIMWFLGLGGIPALFFALIGIKKESAFKFVFKKLLYMIASAIGIYIIALFYYQNYASVVRNNRYIENLMIPASFIHNTYRYLSRTYFAKPLPYQKIGLDATQTPEALELAKTKPMVTVLVIGETARGHNFPVNGYARDTTPFTDKITNMVSV